MIGRSRTIYRHFAEAAITVAHQDPNAARGWLPTLDADQRFPTASAQDETSTGEADTTSQTIDVHVRSERLVSQDWSAAIENQFGLRSADLPAESSESETPAADPTTTIAALEDRLAYYEHFDALIKDNISRSAELFQAVFTEREKARSVVTDSEALMSAVAVEAERRSNAERQHMQHILMSLMDEATFLQQRSDALVQRVAEAITEMTAFRDEDDEPVSGA